MSIDNVTPIRPGGGPPDQPPSDDDTPMPSRKVIEGRLEDLKMRIWRAQGVINVLAQLVDTEPPGSDDQENVDKWNALNAASKLLEQVSQDLDASELLHTG